MFIKNSKGVKAMSLFIILTLVFSILPNYSMLIVKANPLTYRASTGFSTTTQGSVWYYQYGTATYQNLSYYDTGSSCWKNGSGTLSMGSSWQSPGENDDIVRTWKAPSKCRATITSVGNIAVWSNTSPADGVLVKVVKHDITKNIDIQLWPTSGWQTIAAGSSIAMPTIETTVTTNDTIMFVLNKNQNTWYDGTGWDPEITVKDLSVDKSKLFGMCAIVYELDKWNDISYTKPIKLMQSLGSKRWRNWMNSTWLLTDPSTVNTTEKNRMDSYITEATNKGLEVIGMNSNWFYNSSDTQAVPARDMTAGSAYMTFLQNYEQTWKTMVQTFPQVTYWEIGNEWNNDPFLHPVGYNPTTGSPVFTETEKTAITTDMLYYASRGIHTIGAIFN